MRAITDESRLCTAWQRGGGDHVTACAEVLRSDMPGLRQPLQQNFMRRMPGLASARGVATVSWCWSRHFFARITYHAGMLRMNCRNPTRRHSSEVLAAMRAGRPGVH